MEQKSQISQSMKFTHIVCLHKLAEFCVFFSISTNIFLKTLNDGMPSESTMGKRIALTVTQKLELIRKVQKEASVRSVWEEYGVAKQTVWDIRMSKNMKLYI